MNMAALVADMWEEALRETPAVTHDWLVETVTGLHRRSYRDRLDDLPRNCFGEVIPRIVTVRRNLRRLGTPRYPRLPA